MYDNRPVKFYANQSLAELKFSVDNSTICINMLEEEL